jgi:hypothetical protein
MSQLTVDVGFIPFSFPKQCARYDAIPIGFQVTWRPFPLARNDDQVAQHCRPTGKQKVLER